MSKPDVQLPEGIRIAGAYSWRLLAVAGLIALFIWLFIQVSIVVVPVMVAVLVAALLTLFSRFLQRHKWPKGLAVATSILGLIALIGGLLTLIVQQVRASLPDLIERSQAFITNLQDNALSVVGIENVNLDAILNEIGTVFSGNTAVITSGIASVGSTAGHALAGLVIVIFATIYFLIDGRRIWQWITRLFPRMARPAIDGAGVAGWKTLTNFVKSQVQVAGIDAVGIGIGALLLQLPLAIPIAVAVFLGSFIPVVGAIVTGALAVFVALVFLGPIQALIMLGIVLLVQQVESHILQPFLIGKSVEVHPLAVILSVAVGSFIAGIPGALFAVPTVAVANTMITYIARKKWLTKES